MRSPCLEPGCPDYAAYRGRCQRHRRQRERQINRKGRALYNTKRWAQTRKRKLYASPLCERCGRVATDIHHRHGVANGNPYALEGLEALCRSCHSKETRAEQTSGVGWPE